MKNTKPEEIATAVPYHPGKEKFLLTKRSENTGIHPGKWDFPGGHIQKKDVTENISEDTSERIEDEKPWAAAIRELREETGLNGEIIRTGESFMLETVDGRFRIHPFLALVRNEPELNPEHTDFKWINPEELNSFKTVDGLDTDLEKLDVL